MKHRLNWISILVIAIASALWAEAQDQGPTHSAGAMMREIMAGGTAYAAQPGGEAASTYANLCASCHGANGKGDGPAAAALNPKPKDFANCKIMSGVTDDTAFKAIKGGGQSVGLSPLMPTWGGSLKDQQIRDLVKYIRAFCKK
ncbi:MAG: c-type cytochrome [Alphaproteobacteria bacterium]